MTAAAVEHATAVTAVGEAFKRVGKVNRARVSLRAGLVAATPVVGMLALGTVIGSPTTAVVLGAGAMLSGVAWRGGDAPLVPPIGTMLAAATAIAIATLAGTLTGRWPWLHLGVLVVFCLAAGSATVLGRRGNVVGIQAVIAFIVFGRFPEAVPDALGLAGLVLAGGVAETLFAFALAFPLAWRRQRDAVAAAYRRLAVLSAQPGDASPAVAAALEQADAVLSAPALFAHPRRLALGDLVDEGRRIRLELVVLSSALVAEPARTSSIQAEAALVGLRNAITLIADAAQGDAAAFERLRTAAAELAEWERTRPQLADERLEQRLAAVGGQVSAAIRLALELDSDAAADQDSSWQLGALGGFTAGRPTLGSRNLRGRLLADLRRLRESATLQSAAGRHAIRLAVVVAGTELLVQRVALPRAYWAVVAAATVLRPEFGATFTRGAERALGTCAGVVIATLIAVAIDPSGWGIVAVVGVLACVTYAVFGASFTAGIAGLTGVIVFLLHAVAPGTTQTALDRGIDTIIGGSIGLVAYALWPTWSSISTPPLLGQLVEAQRAYLHAVTRSLVSGTPLGDDAVRPLARASRVAWTDAQAAIELARSEPRRGALDPRSAAATLGALRRVVWAVHGLRLRAAEWTTRPPLAELSGLCRELDRALAILGDAVRAPGSGHAALPRLRSAYREVRWSQTGAQVIGVRTSLDELVDALNTAAASVAVELP